MSANETCINNDLRWRTGILGPKYADVQELKGKAASDLRRLRDFLATITDPRCTMWTELDRMCSLENYNGFELRATPAAYDTAKQFLKSATERLYVSLPEFSPDGEGGIDIEWEHNGRHLALNCGSSGDGNFISWREADGKYEGEPATNDLLFQKLVWLNR